MSRIDDAVFCIPGRVPVLACIPEDLWEAWQTHERAHADESDFTLGELFRDALIDFLRSVGKLPPPYV